MPIFLCDSKKCRRPFLSFDEPRLGVVSIKFQTTGRDRKACPSVFVSERKKKCVTQIMQILKWLQLDPVKSWICPIWTIPWNSASNTTKKCSNSFFEGWKILVSSTRTTVSSKPNKNGTWIGIAEGSWLGSRWSSNRTICITRNSMISLRSFETNILWYYYYVVLLAERRRKKYQKSALKKVNREKFPSLQESIFGI